MALFLVASALFGSLSKAAYCNGKPDPNAEMNVNDILEGASTSVLVRSVPNGKLYVANQGTTDEIPIVHVWGTPMEMGYAQGLLRPDIKQFFEDVYKYMDDAAYEAVNGSGYYPDWMPEWFFDDIVNLGLDAALNKELEWTEPFTPEYFFEEEKGLALATGVPFKEVQWVHLIGELTKGSCSMLGAFDSAIADGQSLVTYRGLDWDMDGPFRNYPQITVYHPTADQDFGVPFANVGYAGFIASFSGVSSAGPHSTHEIGVSYPDDTFGHESRKGIPFTYLLRDILQFDQSVQDSIDRITNANRTCDLILGFGYGNDAENNYFRGVEYSYSTANFYTDTNMEPEADWHPRIPGTVYYGMDWDCPNYDEVFAAQLNALHGSITPELGIQNISAIIQSGDNFVHWQDLTPGTNKLFMSFASVQGESGPPDAYDRAFTVFDMDDVYNTAPPTSKEIAETRETKYVFKAHVKK
jgi:hypothetical protein